MKRRIVTGIVAIGLVAGTALPAAALTDSGTITCTAGATVGARGQQQVFGNQLTVKVRGVNVFNGRNTFVGGGDSGVGGTGSWSATSASLLLSGSYGRCIPPGA